MSTEVTLLYVCPHCFSTDTAPGPCPNCGHTREACNLGDPDHPCRKPPMDADGRLESRAPLWWLARSVPHLRQRMKQLEKQR